jgi:hypothetical protein
MKTGRMKIKIQGRLSENWNTWFDGMEISYEGDATVLTGEKRDMAHLHGILNLIRDLNLKLISVHTDEEIN